MFYDEQDDIVAAMERARAASLSWGRHEWLLQPVGEVALVGTLYQIEPKKAETFTFHIPLQALCPRS